MISSLLNNLNLIKMDNYKKQILQRVIDFYIEKADADKKTIKTVACLMNDLEAINYTRCCESVKGEQVPTFDEFIDKFNLEVDRDNEYFFDGDFFDAMGLYYKYAEHYGINP